MSIRIDPEFSALIPPLTSEEYTQLEKNIIKDGIRDPLVVWPQPDGNSILIDGHNRMRIAEAHHGLMFDTVERYFSDRDQAVLWIINNQLGRRNLPVIDRVTLEDKKRETLARQAKKNIGGDKKSENYKSLQRNLGSDQVPRREKTTDYKIAQAAGTSEDTVRKVRKINELATDKTKQLVREGKLSINQAYNSVAPRRPDPVKQAKQEHEEFSEKKKESVVSWDDIQTDRINQDIISTALLQDVLSLLNKIDAFGMKYKTEELKSLHGMIEDDERTIIMKRCETCRGILSCIENNI